MTTSEILKMDQGTPQNQIFLISMGWRRSPLIDCWKSCCWLRYWEKTSLYMSCSMEYTVCRLSQISICILVSPWSMEVSSAAMFLMCCSACWRSVRIWLQHLCFQSSRDLMMSEKYQFISYNCYPQNYQDQISFYLMVSLVQTIDPLISFTYCMKLYIYSSLGLREQLCPLLEREWLFFTALELDWVGEVNRLVPFCWTLVMPWP